MAIIFGDYDRSGGVTGLDAGMYDATIKSVAMVMENGQPKATQDGKNQVDVYFALDEDTTVKRRYSISFGQNSANKVWAAFAKLIEAATGIKCGDKDQRTVTDASLVGVAVRIVIETNDRGYSDVSSVMPAAAGAKPKPKPVPVATGGGDLTEDEIPFLADPREFDRIAASL